MDKKAIFANEKLNGQVGENAVWDGPLSKEVSLWVKDLALV